MILGLIGLSINHLPTPIFLAAASISTFAAPRYCPSHRRPLTTPRSPRSCCRPGKGLEAHILPSQCSQTFRTTRTTTIVLRLGSV